VNDLVIFIVLDVSYVLNAIGTIVTQVLSCLVPEFDRSLPSSGMPDAYGGGRSFFGLLWYFCYL
jgi:hypothetical protein